MRHGQEGLGHRYALPPSHPSRHAPRSPRLYWMPASGLWPGRCRIGIYRTIAHERPAGGNSGGFTGAACKPVRHFAPARPIRCCDQAMTHWTKPPAQHVLGEKHGTRTRRTTRTSADRQGSSSGAIVDRQGRSPALIGVVRLFRVPLPNHGHGRGNRRREAWSDDGSRNGGPALATRAWPTLSTAARASASLQRVLHWWACTHCAS